ncbi:MAG: NAD(P)H-dependent glycerol-3-phosphate dehydrogenase, partial [Paracoccaceae bacterium]
VIGAELGGALKNVIAIACGATIGAGYGDSARAALMTRGYAEMCRIANTLGAKESTLSGLSGFGDLSLTCMSEGSRNFSYGLALGGGRSFDPSVTVEGVATAKAVLHHPNLQGEDMPITRLVHHLSTGDVNVKEAMQELMSRPQKEE